MPRQPIVQSASPACPKKPHPSEKWGLEFCAKGVRNELSQRFLETVESCTLLMATDGLKKYRYVAKLSNADEIKRRWRFSRPNGLAIGEPDNAHSPADYVPGERIGQGGGQPWAFKRARIALPRGMSPGPANEAG